MKEERLLSPYCACREDDVIRYETGYNKGYRAGSCKFLFVFGIFISSLFLSRKQMAKNKHIKMMTSRRG